MSFPITNGERERIFQIDRTYVDIFHRTQSILIVGLAESYKVTLTPLIQPFYS